MGGNLGGQTKSVGSRRSKGSDGLSRFSGELLDEEVSLRRMAAKATDNGGNIDSVCRSKNLAAFC